MAHPDYERHATVFENAEDEAEHDFYAGGSIKGFFDAAYDFVTHVYADSETAVRRPYLLESLEPETYEDHMRYEENARYDYLRESGLIDPLLAD